MLTCNYKAAEKSLDELKSLKGANEAQAANGTFRCPARGL